MVVDVKMFVIMFGIMLVLLPSGSGLGQDAYLKLEWVPNFEPNVQRYIIYRSTSGIAPLPIDSVDHPTNRYYDYNVEQGLTYQYQLAARNDINLLSERSLPVSGIITQNEISVTPAGLYGVTISWETVAPSQSQLVYGSEFPLEQYTDLSQAFSTYHTVLLDFLEDGKTYYFSCLAYDPDGNLSASQDSSLIFSSGAAVGERSVIAYPNPFRGRDHQQIFFDGLAPGNRIYLYNVNGERIWSSDATTSSRYQWDLQNQLDDRLGSGVYVYRVTNSNGKEESSGKIVIIQ